MPRRVSSSARAGGWPVGVAKAHLPAQIVSGEEWGPLSKLSRGLTGNDLLLEDRLILENAVV